MFIFSFLQNRGDPFHCLNHIGGVLRARFKKHAVFGLCQRLAVLEFDNALHITAAQINLVANYGEQTVVRRALPHRRDPIAQTLERLLGGHVVHANNTVCFAEILFRDAAVPFLTGLEQNVQNFIKYYSKHYVYQLLCPRAEAQLFDSQ